ncbi:hypothetical protein BY996DRAFT_3117304 [Phakopsora pachyrhizi]|nr:hypothetical protein BY996DRAFT_3117304 [Phakopsora pachyrhizi]
MKKLERVEATLTVTGLTPCVSLISLLPALTRLAQNLLLRTDQLLRAILKQKRGLRASSSTAAQQQRQHYGIDNTKHHHHHHHLSLKKFKLKKKRLEQRITPAEERSELLYPSTLAESLLLSIYNSQATQTTCSPIKINLFSLKLYSRQFLIIQRKLS